MNLYFSLEIYKDNMNYKWSDEKYSSSNKKYKWGKNEEGDYAIVQFRKYK